MSSRTSVFNRWELKYILPIKQMYSLMNALDNFVVLDDSGIDGKYKIKSIYYDSSDFRFYNEKINGLKYRQKIRLRGYGNVDNEDNVFFEIKQRYSSTVQKRRAQMPLNEAYRLLEQGNPLDRNKYNHEDIKVLDEICYLSSIYALEPKLIVSYDRKAFMGRYEEGLRITFDTNLKCSNTTNRLENRNKEKYFIHPSLSILEVKSNDKIPIWFVSLIQRYQLESHRVSKYCLSVDTLYQHNI